MPVRHDRLLILIILIFLSCRSLVLISSQSRQTLVLAILCTLRYFFWYYEKICTRQKELSRKTFSKGAEKLRDERSVPCPVFKSWYFSLLASLHWEPCTCFSVSHHHYLRWDRISTTGRIGYFPFPQVGYALKKPLAGKALVHYFFLWLDLLRRTKCTGVFKMVTTLLDRSARGFVSDLFRNLIELLGLWGLGPSGPHWYSSTPSLQLFTNYSSGLPTLALAPMPEVLAAVFPFW